MGKFAKCYACCGRTKMTCLNQHKFYPVRLRYYILSKLNMGCNHHLLTTDIGYFNDPFIFYACKSN